MTLTPYRRRRGGRPQAAALGFRVDPYREMEEINNRFDQLIQTFFENTSGATAASAWSRLAPPIDVEETDNAYVVEIDLPNVSPEDVTIEMRGEELRVAGRFQQRERTGVVRRQSRPTGDFEYLVDLPSDIDPSRVEATYDSGVVTVTVGKAQDAQPRRIEIREVRGHQQARQIAQGDEATGDKQRAQQQRGRGDAQPA
jgi:HSP20 family protein